MSGDRSQREGAHWEPGLVQIIFNPLFGTFMMVCAAIAGLLAYLLANPGIAVIAAIVGFLIGGWIDYRLIVWAGPANSQPARLLRILVLLCLGVGIVLLLKSRVL